MTPGLYTTTPAGVARAHADGRFSPLSRPEAIRQWNTHCNRARQLRKEAEALTRRADLQDGIAAELEACIRSSEDIEAALAGERIGGL